MSRPRPESLVFIAMLILLVLQWFDAWLVTSFELEGVGIRMPCTKQHMAHT
jgi:hypothetical protein